MSNQRIFGKGKWVPERATLMNTLYPHATAAVYRGASFRYRGYVYVLQIKVQIFEGVGGGALTI